MTTLTDSTLIIANRMFEIVDEAKAFLGISDVWFGDQQALPRTPSLCVEPGMKKRTLQGVPNMPLTNIDTIFLLYHSKVDIDQQTTRRDCIKVAEDVELYLHQHCDPLLASNGSQLTIQGMITEADPGYSYKSRSTYNAVQMTFTSQVKVNLQRLF